MNGPSDRIVIVDLRIPFWRLVLFFIKSALATVVAAIVVGAVLILLSAVIVVLFGDHMDVMIQRWRL
jgi:hypothetical protein